MNENNNKNNNSIILIQIPKYKDEILNNEILNLIQSTLLTKKNEIYLNFEDKIISN